MHRKVHYFLGDSHAAHMHPESAPAADPIFMLLHCFMDYIRLQRQDCYDFDLVANADLEQHPSAYTVIETDLDYTMNWGVLCGDIVIEGKDVDLTNNLMAPYCADHDIAVRDMFDTSVNTKWNVLYELGDFWNLNSELQGKCADHLNETWWSNEDAVDTVTESEDAVSLPSSTPMSMHWTSSSIHSMLIWMTMASALVVVLRFTLYLMIQREPKQFDSEYAPLLSNEL